LSHPHQDAIDHANAFNNDDCEDVGKEDEEEDGMLNSKYKATIQAAESALGFADGTSGYRMAHFVSSEKDAMPNYSPTGSEEDATLQAAKAALEDRSLEDRDEGRG
jgi:hypothetical protein